MKKLVNYIAVLLASVILFGCGGGSSSNSNTTPPENASNTFGIKNLAGFDMARVEVRTKAGIILLDEKFDCNLEKKCFFGYRGAQLTEPVDLYFFDKNNRLGNVFLMIDTPTGFVNLIAKPNMMGMYVYEKLVNKYQISGEQLFIALDQFFADYESPDGLTNNYEELGLYYKYKVIEGGMSEPDFYDYLNTRLSGFEVESLSNVKLTGATGTNNLSVLMAYFNKNNILSKFNLVGDAFAQASVSQTCPTGLTAFMKFTAFAFDFFPIPGAGEVAELASGLTDEACDGKDDMLAKIYTDIQSMKESLKIVEGTSQQIKLLLGKDIITKSQDSLDTASKTVELMTTNYSVVTSKYTDKIDANGKKVSKFKQYLENEGGLAAVINSTNIAKHGPAQKLIASLEGSTSKDSIFDTLNNKVTDGVFTSLADAIDTLCGDEKLMAGDIVSSRTACNLAILRATSTTAGIYGNSLSIMKEVYAEFEAYKDQASLVKPIDDKSWNGVYTKLENQYNANLTSFKAKFKGTATGDKKGFYLPLKGLPVELSNHLKKEAQCFMRTKTNQKVNEPAIVGWFGGENNKDSYIVTWCLDMSKGAYPFKSRYFYGSVKEFGGLEPKNIMGVLVAKNYADNVTANYAETNGISRTYGNLTLQFLPVSKVPYPESNKFAVSVSSNRKTFNPNTILQSWGKPGYTNLEAPPYKPISPPVGSGETVIAPFAAEGTSDSNFIRYTDTNGDINERMSYIWKMRLVDYQNYQWYALSCLSAECSLADGNNRITFTKGALNSVPENITGFKALQFPYFAYEIGGKVLR